VSPNIYGAFLEPIKRTVYGRIYDPRSPFADEDGFRKDLITLLRELKVTNVRYPGGNMVSGYNWEDGIGPKDKRPARLELAWNQVDSNQVGTDEYIKFMGKIGAENILCVNAGTGTVDQARHWVEYCNTDRGTYYSGLRRQNGHPQPYKITHWGIGNEVDGPWQMGYKNVEDYCKFALEAAKLMKWTDTSIRITASGSANYFNDEFPDADWIKWNRTVLTELRQYIDYLSIHRYWEDKTKDYYTFMSGAEDLEEKIGITASLIKEVSTKYRLKKPVYIAFDEYAVAIPPNYLNGICLAQYLNAFIRHADIVKQANYTQLSELVADSKGGFYKTPISHVFQLYSNNCMGTSLDIQVLCDQFDAGLYKHIPYLDVTAVYDRSQKRVIINVVNRNKDQAITAEILPQTGGWGPRGIVNILDGNDLQATNGPDRSNVSVKQQSIGVGKDKLTYTFPPHSFCQLILEQR